jgi:hypothetical protein
MEQNNSEKPGEFGRTILLFVIGIIACIAVIAVFSDNSANDQSNISNSEATTTIVGNDRDTHGCIGSAGYSWCAVKNKCLRAWEEKCQAAATTTTGIAEPPTAPITFSKTGNLTYRGEQKTDSGWTLTYEEPGKPALLAFLRLDSNSVCNWTGKNESCLSLTLTNGTRAKVEGYQQTGTYVLVTKITAVR